MEHEVKEEETISRYLLGDLSEDEMRMVEERLMTDNDFSELALLVENKLVDDYVEGALKGRDRDRFEKLFLSTPQGREQVRFTRALKEYATSVKSFEQTATSHKPVWLSGRWVFAAAVILLITAGITVWRVFIYTSEIDRGLAALSRAYREQRLVSTRITGLDYAPPANTRGDEQSRVDEISLRRAEIILLGEVDENPGPLSRQALGRFYLARREFDKAIDQFNESMKLNPNDAHTHSDLGAALLERGKVAKQTEEPGRAAEDFARSIEHLNRALELNAVIQEAIFNRALALQEMGLSSQAEEEWRKYLDKDSSSQWADEARQNLRRLEESKNTSSNDGKQILDEFLMAWQKGDEEESWKAFSRSREPLSNKVVSEQLLDAYLEASASGDSEVAKKFFDALFYAGDLEVRRAGDFFTPGLTNFYRSISPSQKEALRQARSLMKQGHAAYTEARFSEAINIYIKARQEFDESGNQWESILAEHWIGYCFLESARPEQSLSLFDNLVQVCERNNYKWLLARSLLFLSSSNFALNEFSKAIYNGDRSLRLAREIGDAVGEFNALSVLMEFHRHLGNFDQAFNCIQRSLPLLNYCPLNPIQIWRHYELIVFAFGSSSLFDAALAYQEEAMRVAVSLDRPPLICVSSAYLGSIHARLAHYDEATKMAEQAQEAAFRIPDEFARKHWSAYTALHNGHVLRQLGDWEKAIASYDNSLGLYSELDLPSFIYQARKGRLSCYIARHDDRSAAEEIEQTLALVEKDRSRILEEESRNNFFDIEQSVYDLASDFEYARMNDPEKAFEYSEASRARSLLSAMSSTMQSADSLTPLSIENIRQRMTDRAQILQYAVLDDRLLIWVISRAGFFCRQKEISRKSLTERTFDFLQKVSRPNQKEDPLSDAKELFDLLIEPVESLLDENKELRIIPDKVLFRLPYNALYSSVSKKYMAEKFCLGYSPSASVFILCSEGADRKMAKDERLLAVGNPLFDRSSVFKTLPDLSSANREISEIARSYNSPRLLSGSRATERVVKSEMERSDVIHFALHSVVNERYPMLSKLLLTKPSDVAFGPESDGVLQASEIYDLNLSSARLAVLSACQTGIARQYNGEGMLSLARPFIAKGVPVTIASLWPVESDSAAELMIAFHRYRRLNKLSTTEALKRAQIDMLAGDDQRLRHPYFWAAFVVVGGHAKY